MKTKTEHTRSEQEIDAILNSLDGSERAGVSPYFITRLTARMERKEPSVIDSLFQAIGKPAVSFAILAGFLVVNLVTMTLYKRQAASQQSPSIQTFAQEYNMGVSNMGY